ncbi:MAG: hypothetical protein JXB50_11005 [Spirochaetes bacterium]|nr:hypothetical protein [Spirochaetota bacterium]
MNFLSHFYLHNKPEDNYYTVGLTLPDLLQFQSKKLRLTKKFLSELKNNTESPNLKSLIKGMLMHITVDSWFHNHDFFKINIKFLEEDFTKYNEFKYKLPHFFSHILLEILIDRYILTIEYNIADKFYDSYKKFNFHEVCPLMHKFPDFNKNEFIKFTDIVANSTFLKEYKDDHSVVNSLKRVCKRIGIPFNLYTDDDKLAEFIKNSYLYLDSIIACFLKETEKDLSNINLNILIEEVN